MSPKPGAGHQSSPQQDHHQETFAEAPEGHKRSASRQLSAPHPTVETNVTKSGHLSFDDVPHQPQAGSNHQQSSSAQEQEDTAPEVVFSSRPAAGSQVATDSVRLDASYPRVAGSAAVPLRSPFCSDDSAPPTPRIRAAPPKATQAAHSSPTKAVGRGAAQQTAGVCGNDNDATAAHAALTTSSPPVLTSAFQETTEASDSPDKLKSQQEPSVDAAEANEPREAAGLASGDKSSSRQAVDASAATEPEAEASPELAAAPQMPAWLMAELRSPSRRQLQV